MLVVIRDEKRQQRSQEDAELKIQETKLLSMCYWIPVECLKPTIASNMTRRPLTSLSVCLSLHQKRVAVQLQAFREDARCGSVWDGR